MDITTEAWTELADRENDRIEVTLLWSPDSGRVRVTVFDPSEGEKFELDVAACDALDAYYHPYAYASHRRRSGSGTHVDTDLHVRN